MKSIVHIVDSLCVGGRENLVIDICNNLNRNKYKVYIISLSDDDNEAAIKLSSDITFLSLPIHLKTRKGRIVFALSFLSVRNKLVKLLENINPHLIHTHSFVHRLLIIALALRSFSNKVKFFHTVHTSGMYFAESGLINSIKLNIEKFALNLYNPSLIAISEIVQDNNILFFKKYTKQTKYIPNGINLNAFDRKNTKSSRSDWNADDNDIIISYVSRLSSVKNHIVLLKAMIRLVPAKKNIKLYLAGDGELRDDLQFFVEKNNLQNYVFFLGSINNVPELLSITDIGVFPSEYEGFGLSLIEMMSMQLPVVVSDNEIFKRFISHGKNGLIFPMHDAESLFENILKLLEDQKLLNSLKIHARKFAEQFSLEKMILGHESYYELND